TSLLRPACKYQRYVSFDARPEFPREIPPTQRGVHTRPIALPRRPSALTGPS
ncbi:hypothetical protein JMJ77_0012553, partial [Colletotrichum scovillei]